MRCYFHYQHNHFIHHFNDPVPDGAVVHPGKCSIPQPEPGEIPAAPCLGSGTAGYPVTTPKETHFHHFPKWASPLPMPNVGHTQFFIKSVNMVLPPLGANSTPLWQQCTSYITGTIFGR